MKKLVIKIHQIHQVVMKFQIKKNEKTLDGIQRKVLVQTKINKESHQIILKCVKRTKMIESRIAITLKSCIKSNKIKIIC